MLPSRVLLVIAPERFRDEEALVPLRRLEEARFRVQIASTRLGRAKGMGGAVLDVGTLVSEAQSRDYAAVVVVGGTGSPDHLWGHDPLLRLLRETFAAGKPVAGICYSGAVLARAGVLAGRRATVFPESRAVIELQRGGALHTPEAVVVDGKVVTGQGPEAAEAFAQALLDQLRS